MLRLAEPESPSLPWTPESLQLPCLGPRCDSVGQALGDLTGSGGAGLVGGGQAAPSP